MRVLEVHKLKKLFPDRTLFSDLSFTLNDDERLSIIGLNGVGKTTLLKMILGEEEKESGVISIANNLSIGYLPQEIAIRETTSLIDYMDQLFSKNKSLEEEFARICELLEDDPNNLELLSKYGTLEDKLSNMGYNYSYKIDDILNKFGFNKEAYNRPLASFSGGECSKIAFARLLLQNPNLLILDEPTNHLDITTIEWLEDYLMDYKGAIIFVSHDRFFIDAVANKVLEISDQTGTIYKGNYTNYLNEKTESYERELKKYNIQQKEIKRLEALIKKFMPKPTKVSFARQQENRLKKMNIITKPKITTKKIQLQLETTIKHPVKILSFLNLSLGYDNANLVNSFSDTIYSGEHVGIVGANGSGKTTLLKSLFSNDVIKEGKVFHHRELNIGYYEQELMNDHETETVFDYFGKLFPKMDDFAIRNYLAKFLFIQDDVFKVIGVLSGGEKARLSFAKILQKQYDVLVLDEPTNHMDLESKKALEDSLSEYSGTVIFVSHDRYFIDSVGTKLYVFVNGEIKVLETSYNEYYLSTKTQQQVKVIQNEEVKKTSDSNKELKVIENRINKLNEEIKELENIYNNDDNSLNIALLEQTHQQITNKRLELNKLEEEYILLLD
jgi:ATP-binding cassette subfamily F protein 3